SEPGVAPDSTFLALNLSYSAVLAVAAGWVTAKAAPRAALLHAAALAGVLLLLSGAALLGLQGRSLPEQPAWYPTVKLVLGPLGAIAGGLLYAHRSGRA
ncbi:MAG: hypothetical protein ACRELC_05785, partial [Gemmatimonadota bacterium]